jgi:hypothetical protein
MIEVLTDARRRLREAYDDRIVLETSLVKLAQTDAIASVGELIERLAALEGALQGVGMEPANPAPAVREAPARPEPGPGPEAEDSPRASAPTAPRPTQDEVVKTEEIWQSVLRAVQGRQSWLQVNLAIGHLQRVADGEVVIAFPADRPAARDELEKREHRKALEEVLREVLGRPVTLRLVTVSGAPAAERPEEAAARDPMVQEAIRAFEGRILSA